MYPIEKNIQILKSYIRNMNRPERSIAEGYLGQKCMNFYTMYLNKLETRRNQPIRNQDDQCEPIEPVFEFVAPWIDFDDYKAFEGVLIIFT